MSAQSLYRAFSGYFRRRLNAGGEIRLPTHGVISDAERAAFNVVQSSGRTPAPAFCHALHYPWNYGPNARVRP